MKGQGRHQFVRMKGNFLCWFFPLGAVAVIVASVSLSDHPREQTAFLERFADKIERARRIPPETERSVREMIVSVRRNEPKADSEFENRQKLAVQRIESALQASTARRQEAPAVLPEGTTTLRFEAKAEDFK